MTIGCLLKEREIKSKSKKVGSGTLKERSLRSKINKIGVSRKASAAARWVWSPFLCVLSGVRLRGAVPCARGFSGVVC